VSKVHVREVETDIKELERQAYEQLRKERKLSPNQKAVLSVIKYSYERGHGPVPNYLIKQITGLNQSQVEQITNNLHKQGLIKRVRRGVWEYKAPVIKIYQKVACKHLTTKNGRYYCPVYGTYIEDVSACKAKYGKLVDDTGKVKQIQFSDCPGFTFPDEATSIEEARKRVMSHEAKEIGLFRYKYGKVEDPESYLHQVYVRPHQRKVKIPSSVKVYLGGY